MTKNWGLIQRATCLLSGLESSGLAHRVLDASDNWLSRKEHEAIERHRRSQPLGIKFGELLW